MKNSSMIAFAVMTAILLTFINRPLHSQSYRGEKPEWVLQIGGPNDDFSSFRVAVDNDGNAIVAGDFEGSIEIGGKKLQSEGERDIVVVKVSHEGQVMWSTQIGGPFKDVVYSHGLKIDNDGNIHLCFYSLSETATVNGVAVPIVHPSNPKSVLESIPRFIKLNSEGGYEWIVNDVNVWYPQDRDGERSIIHRITLVTQVDNNNCLLVAVAGAGPFVEQRKYSPTGKLVYKKEFQPGSGVISIESLATDAAGNSYSALSFQDSVKIEGETIRGQYLDFVLLKYDSNGTLKWKQTFSGYAWDRALSIWVSNDSLFVVGYYGMLIPVKPYPFNFDTTSVKVGSSTLKRTDVNNGFLATYSLNGTHASAQSLPFSLGPIQNELAVRGLTPFESQKRSDTLMFNGPGYE